MKSGTLPIQASSSYSYSYRFDFILHANQDGKSRNKQGRDGKKYEHNDGVFKIRFQGLLACEIYHVATESTLVYNKLNADRATAEVELAELFLETHTWPHAHSYSKVILG